MPGFVCIVTAWFMAGVGLGAAQDNAPLERTPAFAAGTADFPGDKPGELADRVPAFQAIPVEPMAPLPDQDAEDVPPATPAARTPGSRSSGAIPARP